VKFRFRGLPAHASASPHEGRSALDAVELMNVGVNYMREHVKEDARIHYVVTSGGGQPNVVPPDAEVWYYIRANKHTDVEQYYAWIKDIAEGAAKMTRTTLASVQVDADMHEVLPNRTLSEIIQRNLELVGAPTFTDERRRSHARPRLRSAAPSTGRSRSASSPAGPTLPGRGSTDVGDISWFVPVGQFDGRHAHLWRAGHSWQIVACTGMSIGEKGMLVAARALAASAVDLYQSPALREKGQGRLHAGARPAEVRHASFPRVRRHHHHSLSPPATAGRLLPPGRAADGRRTRATAHPARVTPGATSRSGWRLRLRTPGEEQRQRHRHGDDATMIPSDQLIGNFPPNASFSQTIFSPTKTRTTARPYFSMWNLSMAPASMKYIARSPRMAKMFDVKTMRARA